MYWMNAGPAQPQFSAACWCISLALASSSKGGAHYFQHAGADASLAVRLAYGFFASGQNYAAPGAKLLQAAVFAASAAACAVGQHIHDLFQALLLVACKLALVYTEREVAVKASHSLKVPPELR